MNLQGGERWRIIKSLDVALRHESFESTPNSPAWHVKIGGIHLRQMLEKPLFSEGQGVGSTVYVDGKDVGEVA